MQRKENEIRITKKKVEKSRIRRKTLTRLLHSSVFRGTTYIPYDVEFHLTSLDTVCYRASSRFVVDKHFREKTIGLYSDAGPVG